MRGGGSPGQRAGAVGVVVITAVLAVFFLDVLLGASTFYLSDLVYAGHPTKKILRETLLSGEIPQWNRWIGAGQPLAANPAYQAFYPLSALVLLPDFTWGFNLFILLHVFIAAFGMYALLRSMDAGPPASVAAALAFSLGAMLAVHELLPICTALAWLPWTCLYARRFLRDGAKSDFALAALFFGIQLLLGEVAVVLQTGAILGCYALAKRRARGVGIIALLCVAAVLLAAVQFFPAIDLARDSVRSRGFPFERVTSWSMPVARLVELFNPNFLGHQLLNGRAVYWGSVLYGDRGLPFVRSIYPGLVLTVLALTGFLAKVRGRALLSVLLVLSVLLALGSHTPLWRALYETGLARSIRYPEKFILMGFFALIVYGARVLDRALAGDEEVLRAAKRMAAAIAIVFGATALFALTPFYAPLFITLWNPSSRMFAEMLPASRSGWFLAAGRAALLFILLRNLSTVRRPLWLALAGALVVLDLGLVVPELAPRMPRAYVDEPPRIAAEFHARHRDCRLFHMAALQPAGVYRTQQRDLYWIDRNAMYPLMPASWGIPTALEPDFDRTALLPTAAFTEAVLATSTKDPQWLERAAPLANICAVAVFADPKVAYAQRDTTQLQPVRLIDLPPSPRYALRNGIVRSVRETANTARIETESPRDDLLFMSVTPHKYWRVTIDGKPAKSEVANIAFQRLPVPAGKHVVEMRYRNPLIAIGAVISLLTAAILLIVHRSSLIVHRSP